MNGACAPVQALERVGLHFAVTKRLFWLPVIFREGDFLGSQGAVEPYA